ncbi:hypothetical protein [Mesorhizobium australicum]|uniref:hypothetical protein n=1 Tax=Mesorhizobium australicum TaxID=536018 RepID=UPI00333A254E
MTTQSQAAHAFGMFHDQIRGETPIDQMLEKISAFAQIFDCSSTAYGPRTHVEDMRRKSGRYDIARRLCRLSDTGSIVRSLLDQLKNKQLWLLFSSFLRPGTAFERLTRWQDIDHSHLPLVLLHQANSAGQRSFGAACSPL